MTITLQNLRRSIGRRSQQRFFADWGTYGEATGGTTTTLVDSNKLGAYADNALKGSYVYFPATQVTRRITASDQSSTNITWVGAVTTVVSGDDYEIWHSFTPTAVHDAINQALRDAWPFLFDYVEDFLVLQNSIGTGYSLTSLTRTPRYLASVYMETLAPSYAGQVTTVVAQNRLKDTNNTFTSDDVGKQIRIYDGTSQGDIRTISSLVDSNTVEVSVNFTSTLATDSKYRMVDVNAETHGYKFITEWSVDKFSNPTKLRIGGHPFGYEGYTLRLLYESEYTALSAEADTTTVPQEYVELNALAHLYAIKLSSAPVSELKNWSTLYELMSNAAAQFAAKNRFQHLSSTWADDQHVGSRISQEYPFNG